MGPVGYNLLLRDHYVWSSLILELSARISLRYYVKQNQKPTMLFGCQDKLNFVAAKPDHT